MKRVVVRLKRIGELRQKLPLPMPMTEGSAGLDLHAAVKDDLTLQPLERVLVSTGLAIQLPEGYAAEIRPRSGLAIRDGVTLLNTPGTVDQDYRGEIKVILINLGHVAARIRSGQRIAQLIVHKVHQVQWEEVDRLQPTGRGSKGFGSTGEGGNQDSSHED